MVHALILGGHGKIALHLTKILADRSHNVTSIIRNPHHGAAISAISPLVVPRAESLEDATDASAEAMMDGVDWVIWSAGAGGKGGKERTKAVDELAAKRFIAAAIRAPSVKRFLMVSACCARRSPASWWDQQDVKVGGLESRVLVVVVVVESAG